MQALSLRNTQSLCNTPPPLETVNRFDAFFAESDGDMNRLISHYLDKEPGTPLALVRCTNDFDQEGMTVTPRVVRDTHGRVVEQQCPGMLNGSDPATIIIDCRQMSPGSIASRNELLEVPPKFRGQPLNPACQIVVVINKAMTPKLGSSARNKCGDDFWRRISRCNNNWTIPGSGQNLMCDTLTTVPPLAPLSSEDQLLDFSTTSDWYSLLMGQVKLDQYGNRTYAHSPLYDAIKSSQCHRIILRDAPWHDPRFKLAIEQLLVRREYEVDGELVSLDSTAFVCQDANPEQNKELLQTITFSQNCDDHYFCLNRSNIEDCLGESVITENSVRYKDVLGSILKEHKGLRITSPLSALQWKQLLLRLKYHHEQRSEPVLLAVDAPTEQPLEYVHGMQPAIPKNKTHAYVVKCDDEDLISQDSENLLDQLLISVTPDMELAQISGEMAIRSTKRRSLDFQASALLQALTSGRPVVLKNLHKNPTLQRQLEGLCQSPARLLINGELRFFNEALVMVATPRNTRLSSPVWNKTSSLTSAENSEVYSALLTSRLQVSPSELNALNEVNSFLENCLKTVPDSARKLWPTPSQKPRLAVMSKVIRQVRALRLAHLSEVESWQQAVQQTILGEYDGNPEMSAYLQHNLRYLFPTPENKKPWLDPTPFKELISSNDVIDRDVIKKHFWRLCQGLSLHCLPRQPQAFNSFHQDNMNAVMRALLECCPEDYREALEATLYCFPPKTPPLPVREFTLKTPPSTAGKEQWQQWQEQQLKKLTTMVNHHPLVFLKGEPGAGKSWSATHVAQRLNKKQPPVTITASPQSDQLQLLRVPVTESYLNIANDELKTLNLSSADRAALAQLMKDYGVHEVDNIYRLPLTPAVEHTLKTALSEHAQTQLAMFRDTRIHYEDGPLLKWAKTCNGDGSPIVLIIDEANLAPATLWDIFQGLEGPNPSLCYGGQCLPLTRHHRIIMTGNPETASGRESSLNLRCQAATLYYPSLPAGFLKHCILQPRLEAMSLTSDQQVRMSNTVVTLWERFRVLAPDHEFTPRDIHEICDRLHLYLDMENQAMAKSGAPFSDSVLIHLAWLAVSETLGGECHPREEALESLHHWYSINEKQSVSQTAVEQQFDALMIALRKTTDFCYQGKSVEQLTRVYWSSLNKRQSEKDLNKVLQGKHATLVEGPAGRGKDALLHQVLNQTQTPFVHLNAGSDDWQNIRDVLSEAALKGEVVVISELNLLPSQYLEGELNDIVTGSANPGFHLFATVNPPEYSGRERLSPALQSRFVSCSIGDYSDRELEVIAHLNSTLNEDLTQQVVSWHCRLRQIIQSKGDSALSPGTSTLLALLRHLQAAGQITQKTLQDSFQSLYRIPMEYVGVTLEELDTMKEQKAEGGMPTGKKFLGCLQTLYRNIPNLSPVTLIKGGQECHFNAMTGQLKIPSRLLHQLSEETSTDLSCPILREIFQSVISGIWKAAGMPEKYPDPNDHLVCNLYTEWQRTFAQQFLVSDKHKDACLTEWYPQPEPGGSADTMNLDENQAVIQAVRSKLQEFGTEANPVLYRRFLLQLAPWQTTIQDSFNQLENNSQQSVEMESVEMESVEMEDLTHPFREKPMDTSLETNPGTSRVNWSGGIAYAFGYQTEGTDKKITVTSTFQNSDFRGERRGTMVPLYSSTAGMCISQNVLGTGGFNKVTCLPKPSGYELRGHQLPGRISLQLNEKGWTLLPGITKNPKAVIQFISIQPARSFEVTQDRASGFYMIRLLPETGQEPPVILPEYQINMVLNTTATVSPTSQGQLCADVYSHACPKDIDDVINTHTNNAIVLLRDRLESAQTQEQRLNLITEFCRDDMKFTSSARLTQTDHVAQMKELLTVRPSLPLCRSMAFWILANWCRIPVRFSLTPHDGTIVETSSDGGYTQKAHQLHGHLKNGATYVDQQQNFSDIERKPLPDIAKLLSHNTTDEEIAETLKEVHPDDRNYYHLSLIFAELAGDNISLSGPVSLDLVKEWLQTFSQQGTSPFQGRLDVLCGLMLNINIRREQTPSVELDTIYHSLTNFIIENSWLPLGASSDMIHYLQRTNESIRQKDELYSKTFTHDLDANNDIRRPGQPLRPDVLPAYGKHVPPEEIQAKVQQNDATLSENALNPELKKLFETFFQHHSSPMLIKMLVGEVPGTQYRDTPPGTVVAGRMARQLPPFRYNAAVSSLRPALVVSPALENNSHINKTIAPFIKSNEHVYIDFYQASMARELRQFIPRYVNWAFLNYVYNKSGGANGTLKVLFPAVPGKKEHSSNSNHKTPLMHPYYPAKAGWVVPGNSDEFQAMTSVSSEKFAPNKQGYLHQVWAGKGFNQANLCLLDNSTVQQLFEDYVKETDWQQLIQDVRSHPAWLDHIEATTKRLKVDFFKIVENDRTRLLLCPNSTIPPLTEDDMPECFLVDDILDDPGTSPMES